MEQPIVTNFMLAYRMATIPGVSCYRLRGFPDIFAVSKQDEVLIGENERFFRVIFESVKILPVNVTDIKIKRIGS